MRISPLVATGVVLLSLPAGAMAAGAPASHPTGSDNPGVAHRPGTVTTPALPAQASPTASGQLPSPTDRDAPDTATPSADDTVVGPTASVSAKGKAYGAYCKSVSKKRAAGAKGTPFSVCVTAMAKVASGKTSSPRSACKTLSKKHVAGGKGTPFSLCVSGAAKLKKDQAAAEDPAATEPTDTTAPAPSDTTAPSTVETPAV